MANRTPKQLERHFKGVANHRRIEILKLIGNKKGLALDEIAETIGASVPTISEHTRKLVQAGLMEKKYRGRNVEHFLSPYGEKMLQILRPF